MNKIGITKEENEIAEKESIFIFGYLRKKYCNNSISDLDIILNSLIFSLGRLIISHVSSKDYSRMVELINTSLLSLLKEVEENEKNS